MSPSLHADVTTDDAAYSAIAGVTITLPSPTVHEHIPMKLRHRGLIIAGVIGSFCFGGALYASPYFSLYQMYQAVEKKDLEGVASHVDFPALRESVKTNLRTIISKETSEQNNPLASMFGSVVNGFVLDPVVDSVVTPSGVAALMEGQQLQLGDRGDQPEAAQLSQRVSDIEVKSQYESFNQFAVSVKQKGEGAEPVTLLLSRNGLGWKVTGVRFPSSLAFAKGLLPKNAVPDLNDIGGSASKLFKGFDFKGLLEPDQSGSDSGVDQGEPDRPGSERIESGQSGSERLQLDQI
ncbi:MAG: DUF2939 domain-containing protein [Thermosynechococcaceae cyanobacterium MS004]|nr:DUF2939 domain-containing protein [Thermosynechococcaceae cyanobacterium MS004]